LYTWRIYLWGPAQDVWSYFAWGFLIGAILSRVGWPAAPPVAFGFTLLVGLAWETVPETICFLLRSFILGFTCRFYPRLRNLFPLAWGCAIQIALWRFLQ